MKPKVFEQIELKAPIDSPTFTGLPNSTTPGTTSNDTRIATTEFVNSLKFLQMKTINNPDLDNIKENGIYTLTGTVTNYPQTAAIALNSPLIVLTTGNTIIQLMFYLGANYTRTCLSGGNTDVWAPWLHFTYGDYNAYVEKDGDTMAGKLVAQNNANYTTAQVRNITISQDEPSGGGNGDIWLRYE